MKMRLRDAWIATLLAARAAADTSEPPLSEEEQASKQSENPISNTVHLTVEDTANYLIGPQDRTLNVATFIPILPIAVGPDWTVLPAARIPLVWAPDVSRPTGGTFGLGDILVTPLLSPRPRSSLFWGVGFSARVPTATNRALGAFDTGQLSLGPAATLVVTPGHFVVGVSVNNVWSVVGRDDAEDVNFLTVQPILNYNLPQAWYLTSSPYIVCDWTASSDRCQIPIGAGVGRLALLNPKTAIAFEAHGYWNAARADFAPTWNLRLQMTLSFPR